MTMNFMTRVRVTLTLVILPNCTNQVMADEYCINFADFRESFRAILDGDEHAAFAFLMNKEVNKFYPHDCGAVTSHGAPVAGTVVCKKVFLLLQAPYI